MEGGGENESRISHTGGPIYKKRKTTISAAAQPEASSANTVDPSPFRITWKIDRFSQRNKKKLYSDAVQFGGYKWHIIIYPKGNNVGDLSLYFYVEDSVSLPHGWRKFAKFSLGVYNQINDYTVRKDTQHQFNARQRDWGFASFMPLRELVDPARGYLVNDTLIVEVRVEVMRNVDEKDTAEHLRVPFSPSDKESVEEQNENIVDEETNVDKNIEAQQPKEDIETTYDDEGTRKSNTSKLVSRDLEEIDAMIDEDVIAAIDTVLSKGITLSLTSHHSAQAQEVSKLDPNLSKQLLLELRDVAFKEDLVEKFREGLNPKVNFNAIKEKIDANADAFSSYQLEQVGAVVNLLNNIVSMLEKLENFKKEQDSAKKSTDQNNEALNETRQKILTSKTSLTDQQTQLNSLDAQIADLKTKLEKLQGDRANIVEIQDHENDKIASLNKEVKSIFHRLAADQIKLKSVEDQIPEAQIELESHENLYRIFKVPFCASDIDSEDEESFEEIDYMTDEDDWEEIHEEINLVLSSWFTLPLKSQHPNLPEQLLQELRDIAFKEDLVEKFKQGLAPKVNFNAVKDKFEANADMFSSRQLKQVLVVVNLLNSIEWMFEKLEKLEKERDSTKKSTDQNDKTLKVAREKILTSKNARDSHIFERYYLDVQIADLKADLEKLQGDIDRFVEIEYKFKLEKLQGDRAKIAEIEDQEKDKITSFNKEVKPILHRLTFNIK